MLDESARDRQAPRQREGTVGEALKMLQSYTEMLQSRGQVEGDEDLIGDGIAFAGVAKYPARVKCALLGWMAFSDALHRSGHTLPNEEDQA